MRRSKNLLFFFLGVNWLSFGMEIVVDQEEAVTQKDAYPAYPLQAVLACCNDTYCKDGSSSHPDTEIAKLSLEAAPQKIKGLVKLLASNMFERYKPKDLILRGPSGSGKTTLAHAIAMQSTMPYTVVHTCWLANPFKKSGQENLIRLVDLSIKKDNKPHIVILDSVDSFQDTALRRGETSALWQLLEKYRTNKKIYFIGTSCDDYELVPQMENTFDVETISLPNEQAREKAFMYHIASRKHRITFDCDQSYIKQLVKKTEGFSFFRLEKLLQRAVLIASYPMDYEDNSQSENTVVSPKDFAAAFQELEEEDKIWKSSKKNWRDTAKNIGTVLGVIGPPVATIATAAILGHRLARSHNN